MIELLVRPDVVCSQSQLAEIVGVHSRTIERLALDGVLKTVRSHKLKARHFRLAENVQRFVAHQKQITKAQCSSSSNGDGYNDARARRMRALALLEEMRARERSGELIERAQVMLVFATLVNTTKSHLFAMANKAMHDLAHRSAPEANAIVKRHVTTALRELAAFDPKSLGKTERAANKKNGESEPTTIEHCSAEKRFKRDSRATVTQSSARS